MKFWACTELYTPRISQLTENWPIICPVELGVWSRPKKTVEKRHWFAENEHRLMNFTTKLSRVGNVMTPLNLFTVHSVSLRLYHCCLDYMAYMWQQAGACCKCNAKPKSHVFWLVSVKIRNHMLSYWMLSSDTYCLHVVVKENGVIWLCWLLTPMIQQVGIIGVVPGRLLVSLALSLILN